MKIMQNGTGHSKKIEQTIDSLNTIYQNLSLNITAGKFEAQRIYGFEAVNILMASQFMILF